MVLNVHPQNALGKNIFFSLNGKEPWNNSRVFCPLFLIISKTIGFIENVYWPQSVCFILCTTFDQNISCPNEYVISYTQDVHRNAHRYSECPLLRILPVLTKPVTYRQTLVVPIIKFYGNLCSNILPVYPK